MKQLNYKERDIITNTPITRELFDTEKLIDVCPNLHYGSSGYMFDTYILYLEELRLAYKNTNDIKYFFALVSMLPATYKPVRLRESPPYVRRAVRNYQKKKPEKFFKEKYKPRQKERQKEYYKFKYQNDPEFKQKKREYDKKRYADPEFRQRQAEQHKKWYYKNREKILAKAREKRLKKKEDSNIVK